MTDRPRTPAQPPNHAQPAGAQPVSAHPPPEYDPLTTAIGRAQAGDEQAFRHLYRTVQPRLLNYARAMVGETDAEDVTAEAWANIARDLHRFRGDGQGFLGWSATITRHRAADHLRRHKPAIPLAHDHLPEHTSPHDTASQAEETLSTQAALALIARLPKDQAQAILLRVVIGLDATTAAHILGKRAGAVRTAAHRGLRTLARHLRPAGPQQRHDHPEDLIAALIRATHHAGQSAPHPPFRKPAEC